MPDTSFTDYVTTIVSTWLNQANKLVFWGRRPNVATTTGSANAQILTLETGSLYSAGTEADGDEFVFLAGFTNAAAMTLQVLQPSGTNVARAVQLNGAALTGGEVIAGQPYRVTRKSTTWQLTSLAGTAFGTSLLQAASATAARSVLGLNEGMSTGSIVDAKGDIITATADNTPVRKAVGTNGQTIVADSTQSDGLIWTDFYRDPLNVNPNMLLDQINEGSLYTVNSSAVEALDSWTGVNTGAGVFKLRRLADPDNAARWVTEITVTTADGTIGAADQYSLLTTIEGYDLAQLAPGTASAGSITIQFQFKTNVTGTYCIAVQNSAQSRSYVGTITVSDTNVHNYSVTLTLDTSGTWLYTNGIGCRVWFALASGSNIQTTAGSWQAGNYHATSAQANFMSNTSNVAYLGRFHVIPGNVVCAYKPADIQRELAKAQRQWQKRTFQVFFYAAIASQRFGYGGNFVTAMRATPTVAAESATVASNIGASAHTALDANSWYSTVDASAGVTNTELQCVVTYNARLS